jgi:hypothetical protein
MIAGTYILSGILLFITALLFKAGTLTATTQTIAWCIIFFFASAGASSAYLTVSEIFPMETRALCIAFFYAVGTGLGGAIGPLLFGALINTKHTTPLFWGYTLAAFLMVAAGIVAAFLAVDAEGKQLEDIATPITAAEAEVVGDGGAGGTEDQAGDREAAAAAQSDRHAAAGAAATAGAYRGRRFGRGTSQGWSPYASYSTVVDEELRDEVAAIELALKENGPMEREALKQNVNARRWGPGCFAKALSEGVSAGIVTRAGRNRYALAEGAGNGGSGVPFATGQEEQSGRR